MKNLLFTLSILTIVIIFSCRNDDDFITDTSAQLEFSIDTLRFDTVFTELGSATRILKVFNTHSQPIKIDRITLEEGANSFFRFNIDGDVFSGEALDIEIPAEDSIYIFGEVTVDPDNPLSISPYIISENLIFETNSNTQNVVLEAWGQNANYIPNRFNRGGIAYLSCDLGDIIWDDPKPYVIYGVLLIDSCRLNIPQGTNIYMHGGLVKDESGDQAFYYNDGIIFVLPNGKLNIVGTKEEPVIIQGDRLEEEFADEWGQWAGIRIGALSTGNNIEYTTIKNSIVGVRVDSAGQLTLRNAQIYNTAGSGLIGDHATINVDNTLFYNNGSNSVTLVYGGDYEFNYCTLGSFGVDASALRLSNARCFDLFCNEFDMYRLNATFKNSIIYGSRKDEISLFDRTSTNTFNYNFENCIVRVDELLEEEQHMNFFDNCDPCIDAENDAVIFVDPSEGDFHLDTLSIAEGQAMPLPTITGDLCDEMRDSQTPDIGCFEYIY